MKQDDLIAYLMRQATDAGCDQNGLKDHVTNSLKLGLIEFWNAHPWSFRKKTWALNVDEKNFRVPLDPLFDGFVSVTDQSGDGLNLRYKLEEAMDYDRPNQPTYPPGQPTEFTIEFDRDKSLWYIRFWPIPTARVIKLRGLTAAPDAVDAIPDKFIVGAELAALKRILPASSSKRVMQNGETVNLQVSKSQAAKEYYDTLQYLKTIDSPYRGASFRMMDDSDQVQVTDKRIGPW